MSLTKLSPSRNGGIQSSAGFENTRAAEESETPGKMNISITAPNMRTAEFEIIGTAPLVIHRFSTKAKNEMLGTMVAGSTSKKGKKREPLNTEEKYNGARYISREGWDGFNVACIRNGMVRACSLVDYKMTLAKMCIFIEADGRDALEPQYGLIRIYGKPIKTEMPARVETGAVYITIRPMYETWAAKIRIRFDGDRFQIHDVANLLSRMGEQVGLGEGRASSKNSCGMGWGSFRLKNDTEPSQCVDK